MRSETAADPKALKKWVARFATSEIGRRAEDLNSTGRFPADIWRSMGEAGLLGINLPQSRAGLGCDALSTITAIESFVRYGKSIGLGFSWLIHLIISRYFFLDFGNDAHRAVYLPDLAAGRITASVAISEPGGGAHPKFLKTEAKRLPEEDCFVLNGEKSFLTNGPIADLFIVFAITSMNGSRKGFSALLAPKDTAGLSLTAPLDLGCLKPSPHCGLKLNNCYVPTSAVLGTEHLAYEQMAKLFRTLEDVFMMGLALGGMEVQLDLVLSHMRESGVECGDETKRGLGELRSLIDSLRVMAVDAARLLERGAVEHPRMLSLVLSFRHLSNYYQSRFERLRSGLGEAASVPLDLITHDLVRIAGIAGSIIAAKQKKLGESLLSGKESDAELQQ
jgi:acyl-CoA dehydrogenase